MLQPDRGKHPCAVAGKEEKEGGQIREIRRSGPLYELSARDFWSSRYPVDAVSSAWHGRCLGTNGGREGRREFSAGHTLVAAGDVPLVDADPEGVSGCEHQEANESARGPCMLCRPLVQGSHHSPTRPPPMPIERLVRSCWRARGGRCRRVGNVAALSRHACVLERARRVERERGERQPEPLCGEREAGGREKRREDVRASSSFR